MSDAALVQSVGRNNAHIPPATPLYQNYKGSGWRIERTIATDDKMADAIIDELARRDAIPGPKAHIAIVTEWDTIYSRSLARYFAARIAKPAGSSLPANRSAWTANPDYVHEFSYLRGLDGRVAGPRAIGSDLDQETDDKTKPEKTQKKSEELERPEGESQFDYLRRMADNIRELDDELKHEHEGQIKAIGVLGSDVYDKLLVLRALRKKFPEVVFFTIGLAALYLNDQESDWTRNLIVASPFGLTTSHLLQDRTPPFRDSYQTALYLTTLKALNLAQVDGQDFNLSQSSIQPRIFEIGRTQAIDLSPQATLLQPPPRTRAAFSPLKWILAGVASIGALVLITFLWQRIALQAIAMVLLLISAIGWIASPAESGASTPMILAGLIATTVGLVFLYSPDETLGAWTSAQQLRNHLAKWLLSICMIIFVFIIASFGAARFGQTIASVVDDWREERWFWFQGISIWPTVW
jgi:hypothetical protein